MTWAHQISSFLKFLSKNLIIEFKTIHFDIAFKTQILFYSLWLLFGADYPSQADWLVWNNKSAQLFKSEAIKIVSKEILKITSDCKNEIRLKFLNSHTRVRFRCVYRLNINVTFCRWKWNVFSQNKKKNLSWRRYFIATTIDTGSRKFKTSNDQTPSLGMFIFQ